MAVETVRQLREYTLPDGREVQLELTLRNYKNDQGYVIFRRLVDRRLIGDLTDQEALDFGRRLGWLDPEGHATIMAV
jgi:hypothetical protein